MTELSLLDDDDVIERRGASGARIVIGKKWTTKFDVERTGTFVRDQGAWLLRHDNIEALPSVREVFPTGYIMETLEVPKLGYAHMKDHLPLILNALATQFWPKSHDYRFWDENTHTGYVYMLLSHVQPSKTKLRALRDLMRAAREQVDFSILPTGLTHGDCIVDNLAFRDGAIVLLDPIPATNALPNIRAVDVGRLIQSAIGYEAIRYRQSNGGLVDYEHAVTGVLNQYMHSSFTINEARACVYFAVIHMLRGIRTTTPGTAARLGLWYAAEKLLEVLKSWMR